MSSVLREWVRIVLLTEGRLQDAIRQAPELEPHIRQMAKEDPSGNLKYLAWQVKQMRQGMASHDPQYTNIKELVKRYYVPHLIRTVDLFHRRVKQLPPRERDINAHKSFEQLIDRLEMIPASKSELRREAKKGSKKIFDDGRYLVVKPQTEEASCYYGKGTTWCISGEEDNHFNRYKAQGATFYFVIDRHSRRADEPGGKIAITIHKRDTVEIFDATDTKISVSNLHDIWGPEKGWEIVSAISEDFGKKPVDLFGRWVASWNPNATRDLFLHGDHEDIKAALDDHPELIETREHLEALLDRGFVNIILNLNVPLEADDWEEICHVLKRLLSTRNGQKQRYSIYGYEMLSGREDAPSRALRSTVSALKQMTYEETGEVWLDVRYAFKKICKNLVRNYNLSTWSTRKILRQFKNPEIRRDVVDEIGYFGRFDVIGKILNDENANPEDLDALFMGLGRRLILNPDSIDEADARKFVKILRQISQNPKGSWTGERAEKSIAFMIDRVRTETGMEIGP